MAGIAVDINIGYNARKAEWTYQRDWLYVKRFTPKAVDCKKIVLCFDGVDYACDVFLNGQWLGSHEIAWIPFSFDITDKVKHGEENCLNVLVKAAPYAQSQGGACSKVRHLKTRFAYGWDFSTRLVPLGIWRDVYVHYQQEAAITDLHLVTDTDYKNKKAMICATVTVSDSVENCPAVFTLTHPNGSTEKAETAINGTEAKAAFCIEDAQLWYPNGMGAQPLYNVSVTVGDNWDSRSANAGLRHIDWERTEGAGEDAMRYQPYVNGRRMFIQGYNWVPISQLYGREHKTEYCKRIELACSAEADTVVSAAANFVFHKIPAGVLFLRYTLLHNAGNVADSSYIVKSNLDVPYVPLLNQDVCPICAKLEGSKLTLKNEGTQVVSDLTLECDNDQHVYFSDGCIMLLPGEEVTVTVDFTDDKQVPLYISGFGVQ